MSLRLAFMGTPDFAVPTLAALIAQGHDIAAVYTQPPRPKGRGLGSEPSPVAKLALPAVTDLTTTMSDARPLAPRVRDALGYAMTPLQVLAPYTTDMSELWLRGASFVSQGPRPGVRYARLGVTPGVNTVTGGLLSSGSSLPQDNYPAPGQAQFDRASGLLPVGIPGLGH